MIVDARKNAPREPLACDVCIVGGGAAGITVALELGAAGASVCVLEAGGLDYDRALQPLLAGEVTDDSYPPLHTVRVAGLGGSMRVWAGWCRPLDAIDFERRAGVAHSGWPFGLDELAPHYLRAHEKLDLGPYDYDAEAWERRSGRLRLPLPSGDAASIVFRRSTLNLGRSARAALERTANLRVITHAHVMRLEYIDNGRAVSGVEVATLAGRRFAVHSRAVVVAAGGIESARLLLLSAEAANGCGNERGLVGRFFMEHGYDDSTVYVPADTRRSLAFYFTHAQAVGGRDRIVRGAFALTAERLRREGLRNCSLFFKPAYEGDPLFDDPRIQAALELWDMLRLRAVPDRRVARMLYVAGAPRAVLRTLWRRLTDRGGIPGRVRVRSLFECAPDPDNRVLLGDARDALGRRVARLHWRLSDADSRSAVRTAEIFDAALRAAGLGRLERDGAARTTAHGKHHLGTTRMHDDPAQGVVDANAKVHGKDNLFVTGGSVFTTGGYANPTLTVVALAVRLAAHLHRQLPMLRLHPIKPRASSQ